MAALAVIALLWLTNFYRSVPSYDGALSVTGILAPVQILRDRYAIPHVVAASLPDAAFALGYAHAQDRLWQMETARRFIQGRLAELFGASAVNTDTMMRAMNLYGAAREAVTHLSPQAQQVLQAYAGGVNAYLKTHGGPLPIEFTLAGDTPEPWIPADSIAVLKGMAMQLSGNAFTEVARASLIPVLGRRGVEDFFVPFSAGSLPAYLDTLYGTTQTGQAFGVPDTTASDNWAVDGAHSVTGKPLLANDPHLGFSIPSVWYLAHLSFGDEDMVGGTLAGIPAIVAGRNRHVAWGETNTGPDTEDLYLERLNPDNRREYQVPGGWAEFETRTEIIKVRFGADRRVLLRATRHGPVMPETTQLGSAAPPGYVAALAWTALAGDDTSFDALLGIDRAKTIADAKAAAKSFVTPMQNIVYADDAGHIGLMLPGRVPLRSDKNDSLGLVPTQGWEGRYDWQGFIPSEDMVAVEDPPSGRIATANNDTQPEGYRYTLTREWEAPYRFQRIDSLLAASPKHSLESFKAIQTDIVDTYALALKQRLMAAGPFEGADAAAAQLLASWNGAMSAARPEPLIFAAWARALARRIYGDELGTRFPNFWGYRTEFTLRVLDGVDGEQRWCDDRSTPEIEDCGSRIKLALHDAVTELSQAYGSNPARWRWGDAHKAIHREQPFGSFPVIGGFFNREVEMNGGPFTLLRADHAMASPRPYAAIHGAGYRGLYDLATPDRSLYIISTGQSGNLFSSHYDDLLRLWARQDYIVIPTTRAAVNAAAVNRLVLQPAQSTATHP
ncbi:MAG TPA: penicillin acylase family protein [Micropepsaceae bacterium]|nr:penicillin acylase family protein [Micropepsaceae bacterium]